MAPPLKLKFLHKRIKIKSLLTKPTLREKGYLGKKNNNAHVHGPIKNLEKKYFVDLRIKNLEWWNGPFVFVGGFKGE